MSEQAVPAVGGGVDPVLSALSADLAALASIDQHAVPVASLGPLLEQLTLLQRQLDAQFLRTVATFDASGAWELDGASSARAWMRANLRHTPGAARSTTVTARRIRDLPQLGAALAEGVIGREHVDVVVKAMDRTPARRESIAAAEPVFCEAAKDLDPNQLARVVTRWVHTVDPLSAVEAEQAIHAQRYLSASRTFEGAVRIDGLLGPEQGATVMTALEALSTEGFRNARAAKEAPGDGSLQELTAGQRRADALVELSRRFLDSGDAPEIAGMRPHLQLTVPLSTLTAPPGEAGHEPAELEGVGPVSTEAALRVGCDALLAAMGVDPGCVPVSFGRTRRTVDARMRKMLNRRDGGCRFPGCDRPAAWTQAHHIVHWARGGRTDMDNLILICVFHHHTVHEGGLLVRGSPQDGSLSFHRPDGTPVLDRGRDPTWSDG